MRTIACMLAALVAVASAGPATPHPAAILMHAIERMPVARCVSGARSVGRSGRSGARARTPSWLDTPRCPASFSTFAVTITR